MFSNFFKKIFSDQTYNDSSNLDHEETDKKIKIAVTTVLLESVNADNNLSDKELNSIINQLEKRFDLTSEESSRLIELSQKYRNDNTDIWYFTNLLNEHLDKDDKLEIIEMVWRVIYSDGDLDKFEDSVSHKLTGLLHIEHSKFIDIKLKVIDEINS